MHLKEMVYIESTLAVPLSAVFGFHTSRFTGAALRVLGQPKDEGHCRSLE